MPHGVLAHERLTRLANPALLELRDEDLGKQRGMLDSVSNNSWIWYPIISVLVSDTLPHPCIDCPLRLGSSSNLAG
jgi:hypothetical protein